MGGAQGRAESDAPEQQSQMNRRARRQRQRKDANFFRQDAVGHEVEGRLKPDEHHQNHKAKRQRDGGRCPVEIGRNSDEQKSQADHHIHAEAQQPIAEGEVQGGNRQVESSSVARHSVSKHGAGRRAVDAVVQLIALAQVVSIDADDTIQRM